MNLPEALFYPRAGFAPLFCSSFLWWHPAPSSGVGPAEPTSTPSSLSWTRGGGSVTCVIGSMMVRTGGEEEWLKREDHVKELLPVRALQATDMWSKEIPCSNKICSISSKLQMKKWPSKILFYKELVHSCICMNNTRERCGQLLASSQLNFLGFR